MVHKNKRKHLKFVFSFLCLMCERFVTRQISGYFHRFCNLSLSTVLKAALLCTLRSFSVFGKGGL